MRPTFPDETRLSGFFIESLFDVCSATEKPEASSNVVGDSAG
jgi:hypothetical protein